LPTLKKETEGLEKKVSEHIAKMGFKI